MARRKRKPTEGQLSRRKRALIILLIIALCAGFITALFCMPAFDITEVYCVGNDKLKSEDIIKTVGISEGENIFSVNIMSAKNRLSDMAYVSECNIRREFPNKIKIWVRERTPAAYIVSGDDVVLTDVDGRIIKENAAPIQTEEPVPEATVTPEPKSDDEHENSENDGEENATPSPDPEQTEPPVRESEKFSVPYVYGLTLKNTNEGKIIETQNQADAQQVIMALSAMDNIGVLERVTAMYVEDKTDIRLIIEDRLEVLLGTFDRFEYKIQFITKVLNEHISSYERAVMDFRGENLYVRSPEDGKGHMVNNDKKKSDSASEATSEPKENDELGSGTESSTDEPDEGGENENDEE